MWKEFEELSTFCICLVKRLLLNPFPTLLPPSEIVMAEATGLESLEISI